MYDAYGNLLDDGSSQYTYDAALRLKTVTTGGSTTSYTYNGDGDRVSQTVGTETTTYVIDTATPLTMVLAETTGTDTIRYLHGLDLVAQSDGVSTEYFAYDGLGSVRQVLDAAGLPLMAQTFDPYGNPYSYTGPTESVTHYGYSGEQTDSNGLVFLRARYYAPSMGRFMQMDPSRLENNPYLYAFSNSVKYTDPSGLYSHSTNKAAQPSSSLTVVSSVSSIIRNQPGLGGLLSMVNCTYLQQAEVTQEEINAWIALNPVAQQLQGYDIRVTFEGTLPSQDDLSGDLQDALDRIRETAHKMGSTATRIISWDRVVPVDHREAFKRIFNFGSPIAITLMNTVILGETGMYINDSGLYGINNSDWSGSWDIELAFQHVLRDSSLEGRRLVAHEISHSFGYRDLYYPTFRGAQTACIERTSFGVQAGNYGYNAACTNFSAEDWEGEPTAKHWEMTADAVASWSLGDISDRAVSREVERFVGCVTYGRPDCQR